MRKKPNYRWRPASWNVGQKQRIQRAQPTTVVVNPPASGPSSMPSIVVAATKSPGSTVAIVLGVGAVAFAVMELTGVTHVFTPAPVAPPPPPAAPKPAATPPANATSAAITAATQAITSAAK